MGVISDAMRPTTTMVDNDASVPWSDWNTARPLADSRAGRHSSPAEAPLPLFPPLPRSERYPIDALGPHLSEAAAAISRKVQVPEAIAAQSVLASASLAAQAHADVRLPYGQKRPLSLFFVTVAGSGDRKTTADNEALSPIRRREEALREEHRRAYAKWKVSHAVWAAEKRKIETEKKLDMTARMAQLLALGAEPLEPLHPFLTAPDPTVEGLVKAWVLSPAALGLFSGEGGQFIGGHGMGTDNRLKTAATFSQIWDGHPINRVRASDGVTILVGRRLSVHLMVQPDAAAKFLCDPTLRDQGLLSRFLVAAPESIAGTRLFRETSPEDEERIRTFGTRILSILEVPWPLAHGRRNELEPRELDLDDGAVVAWQQFHDHVENQCGRDRDLWGVQDFAAKAAEHAARIAGVLTITADVTASTIKLPEMAAAETLVDWYVREALRLHNHSRTDPGLLRAQALLDWLRTRSDDTFSLRDIFRLGPPALRQKVAAENALGVLTSHFWVEETSKKPQRFRLRHTEAE
jgi:hypothetical protein